jgi:hypothetical protein
VLHVTTAQLVVGLVFGLVWAAVGYLLSEQARRKRGRTPWGLPSLVWALFWFLSVVIGLVLYLIAQYGETRRAQRTGTPPVGGAYGPPASARAPQGPARPGSQFPAYPRPANSGGTERRPAYLPPELIPPSPPPGAEPPVPTVPPGSSDPPTAAGGAPEAPSPGVAAVPPGWYPDPGGRYHYRWWNGSEWTAQVSVDGHHLVDTSPDQRIGPYGPG